jgi:cellulose 1,4-beta-cellobiosidase
MDIWEANKMSTAFTAHPCGISGNLRCEGQDCGDNDLGQRHMGVCDKDGCDINPARLGNDNFYGPGS